MTYNCTMNSSPKGSEIIWVSLLPAGDTRRIYMPLLTFEDEVGTCERTEEEPLRAESDPLANSQ